MTDYNLPQEILKFKGIFDMELLYKSMDISSDGNPFIFDAKKASEIE